MNKSNWKLIEPISALTHSGLNACIEQVNSSNEEFMFKGRVQDKDRQVEVVWRKSGFGRDCSPDYNVTPDIFQNYKLVLNLTGADT